ncbi:MAG: cytochrome c [Burkholderiales bacterium]|nr:cytochrome c [Burkholderiales bacterium]
MALLCGAMAATAAADEASDAAERELGEAAYAKNCAYCHNGGNPLGAGAPLRPALKLMSRERIRAAVVNGRMRVNARFLKPAELEAVIKYLAAEPAPAAAPPAAAASS